MNVVVELMKNPAVDVNSKQKVKYLMSIVDDGSSGCGPSCIRRCV